MVGYQSVFVEHTDTYAQCVTYLPYLPRVCLCIVMSYWFFSCLGPASQQPTKSEGAGDEKHPGMAGENLTGLHIPWEQLMLVRL